MIDEEKARDYFRRLVPSNSVAQNHLFYSFLLKQGVDAFDLAWEVEQWAVDLCNLLYYKYENDVYLDLDV